MKDFMKNPNNLSRAEFWAATTLFVFASFFLVAKAVAADADSLWTPYKWSFVEHKAHYSFYSNYFFPQISRYIIFYTSFLGFNFVITPRLISRKDPVLTVMIILLATSLIGLLLGVSDTYLRGYLLVKYATLKEAYNYIFQTSYVYTLWLIMMFTFYSVIKYTAQYLLVNSEIIQSRYQIISKEGLIAFVLWMISVFVLLVGGAARDVVGVWSVIVPFGIVLYWYSFYELIPRAIKTRKPFLSYILRIFMITIASILVIVPGAIFVYNEGDMASAIVLFNIAFQLLITAPVSWIVYRRRQAGDQELYLLKTELGRSYANLDFLRSQINPHFLFNALNTLYGTALQEQADRTGEGIQRLGDMMRFMLQENMQEKISLSREIEYLNNYITLQKLRTDTSPEIKIEAEIEEPVSILQIPPMLLIPFVENAFKHGISLREPSHIRIALQTKENTLYFDVNNSIHTKHASDPERKSNGIGLSNVRQRLRLLYPDKHELIIRDTGKEFFIHLTIQLA